MIKVSFSKAKVFEDIVRMASGLLEEATFTIDEDGMTMRSMDPSRVALLDLDIPKSAFEDFEVEGSSKLGVNMERFAKILRRGSSGDTLTLKQDAEDSLDIVFRGKATRSFKLPLRDISENEQELPNINSTSSASIFAEVLMESVKDASLVGDNLTLEMVPGNLKAKAHGNGQETSTVVTEDDEALIELDVEEESKSTYGLSYLESMIKPMGKSDIIDIDLGSDMPLKIKYPIEDEGRLLFVLAPRIENE